VLLLKLLRFYSGIFGMNWLMLSFSFGIEHDIDY